MRKNTDKNKTEPKEKKSRAKYKPPDELEKLIEWASDIKPDVPLPYISLDGLVLYDSIYKEGASLDFVPDTNSMRLESLDSLEVSKKLEELVNFYSSNPKSDRTQLHTTETLEDRQREAFVKLFFVCEAKRYRPLLDAILKEVIHNLQKEPSLPAEEALYLPDVVKEFIFQYNLQREKIINFIAIAKMANGIRKGIKSPSELEVFGKGSILFMNGQRKFDYRTSESLFEILKGLDVDRLRICEICGKIFWAVNKNSETCSKTCLNALRQRRYRRRNKESINAKRKKTYESKKKRR